MSGKQDLLVELGTEELPPKALNQLAQALFDGVCHNLSEAQIEFDTKHSRWFATPRRLSFRLAGTASQQPTQQIQRRGPAVQAAFNDAGEPTPAAVGFAKSVGVDLDQLDRQKTDKGEWLFFASEMPGKPLGELLYPILEKALAQLPVPKPMRWADKNAAFVRPVHWLLVLHGDQVIPGQLFDLPAGQTTRGHRIHAPGPHQVQQAQAYEAVLQEAFVNVLPEQRRQEIRRQVEHQAEQISLTPLISDSLLEEVSNLVEWPVALLGKFDQEFLQVPAEALISSMESHQKFFPLTNSDGRLSHHFVTVANIESSDPNAVIQGFERVIRPRLADAQFFWNQDRKQPLKDYAERLKKVVFQKKLGSISDKSKRVRDISKQISSFLGVAPESAMRAAELAKCDLVTEMVGEFPELQGIMGRYYALASDEPAEVAEAIAEHYAPRFAGDTIPASQTGQILGIAERLDTLVGIFAAGLKPSGNKDPFALRRAALGLIRTLLEAQLPLDLDELLRSAAHTVNARLPVSNGVLAEVREFVLERLRHYFRERGYSADLLNAVLNAGVNTLPDFKQRLEALQSFMQMPEAEALAAANKRISNILKKAETEPGTVDNKLFSETSEHSLFEKIQQTEQVTQPLIKAGDYAATLSQLAELKPEVDSFFDQVMVMAEDPAVRHNRLALLNRLRRQFLHIADISGLG